MDKLADGLQKLQEDDLLQVVQMVHDNKAPDTYIKNDVERKFGWSPVIICSRLKHGPTEGEFHVDLYTLPDALVKMLWEYVTSKVDV
jgi:transcription initiation factor IIF auxiliary subunit